MKYDKKVGKADYRISKVEKVETDNKGLVRTAWVLMRPRDSREKSLPYRSKKVDLHESGDSETCSYLSSRNGRGRIKGRSRC